MNVRSPHACLGCEPCNPGNILADFYRAQQAAEVATPPVLRHLKPLSRCQRIS